MRTETAELRAAREKARGEEGAQGPGGAYRFERLALPLVLDDMRFTKHDLGPGDRFPSFDLPVVSGGHLRLSDLTEGGLALVIFGSSTCPVTDDAAPGLNQLYRRFADRVRFAMVNVREAHPGSSIPQPTTVKAKMDHAEQLRRLHGFEFHVAVDDLDGALHRALSPKPNSAYLLGADGTILFRAQWASDTEALDAAIRAAVAGKPPIPAESGGLIRPTLRMLPHLPNALDRAGRGAWADMWRVAPPLAAIGAMLKLLGAWGGIPAPGNDQAATRGHR